MSAIKHFVIMFLLVLINVNIVAQEIDEIDAKREFVIDIEERCKNLDKKTIQLELDQIIKESLAINLYGLQVFSDRNSSDNQFFIKNIVYNQWEKLNANSIFDKIVEKEANSLRSEYSWLGNIFSTWNSDESRKLGERFKEGVFENSKEFEKLVEKLNETVIKNQVEMIKTALSEAESNAIKCLSTYTSYSYGKTISEVIKTRAIDSLETKDIESGVKTIDNLVLKYHKTLLLGFGSVVVFNKIKNSIQLKGKASNVSIKTDGSTNNPTKNIENSGNNTKAITDSTTKNIENSVDDISKKAVSEFSDDAVKSVEVVSKNITKEVTSKSSKFLGFIKGGTSKITKLIPKGSANNIFIFVLFVAIDAYVSYGDALDDYEAIFKSDPVKESIKTSLIDKYFSFFDEEIVDISNQLADRVYYVWQKFNDDNAVFLEYLKKDDVFAEIIANANFDVKEYEKMILFFKAFRERASKDVFTKVLHFKNFKEFMNVPIDAEIMLSDGESIESTYAWWKFLEDEKILKKIIDLKIYKETTSEKFIENRDLFIKVLSFDDEKSIKKIISLDISILDVLFDKITKEQLKKVTENQNIATSDFKTISQYALKLQDTSFRRVLGMLQNAKGREIINNLKEYKDILTNLSDASEEDSAIDFFLEEQNGFFNSLGHIGACFAHPVWSYYKYFWIKTVFWLIISIVLFVIFRVFLKIFKKR
ncbi:hypothetical protein JXR93_02130 [bacterium]|nr:hypothetical protein [bacterium]